MIIYVAKYQHEPDCPSELGVASRHRSVAVKALNDEFLGIIGPEGVDDEHGYEITKEGGQVASFRDIEGSGPSGHIEELEVEDEPA